MPGPLLEDYGPCPQDPRPPSLPHQEQNPR